MTNGGQTVVWRAMNFPFTRSVATNNVVPLNLGFPGQYFDAELNLWNNGYRDYFDWVGRYLESDPTGLGGGINTYAYVGSNPISQVDPFGLCVCRGKARVYKGNAALIGRGGGFDTHPSDLSKYAITDDSAAVIPSQFGMTKAQMRSYVNKISGSHFEWRFVQQRA